jgi:hypothetical protein
MADEALPKRGVVKVGKLFTAHEGLIAARTSAPKQRKLREVLERFASLFAPEDPAESAAGAEPGPDGGAIDEAVLALLWLGAFEDHGQSRARKTSERDAMDRLHGLGLISDPQSESVEITDKGRRAAEQAFEKRVASTP